jgi:hypothetical protein
VARLEQGVVPDDALQSIKLDYRDFQKRRQASV